MPSAASERPPITLSAAVVAQLLGLAGETPDVEVCGLVGAIDGRPGAVYPVANRAREAARRFDMDPGAQIAAFKQMRERGQTLYAIYHSHPHTPAEPSRADRLEWHYPQALCLILSLRAPGGQRLRAWQLVGERMVERAIRVVDREPR